MSNSQSFPQMLLEQSENGTLSQYPDQMESAAQPVLAVRDLEASKLGTLSTFPANAQEA